MFGNFERVVQLLLPSISSFLLLAEGRQMSRAEAVAESTVLGVDKPSCRRRRIQLCSSAAGGVSLVDGSQSKHCDMKSTSNSSLQLFNNDTSDLEPGAPRRLRCLAAVGGPLHLYV